MILKVMQGQRSPSYSSGTLYTLQLQYSSSVKTEQMKGVVSNTSFLQLLWQNVWNV